MRKKLTVTLTVEIDIKGGHLVDHDCLRGVAYRALQDAVEYSAKDGFIHDLNCTPTLKLSEFFINYGNQLAESENTTPKLEVG